MTSEGLTISISIIGLGVKVFFKSHTLKVTYNIFFLDFAKKNQIFPKPTTNLQPRNQTLGHPWNQNTTPILDVYLLVTFAGFYIDFYWNKKNLDLFGGGNVKHPM